MTKLTAVQSNDLVEASYCLTMDEMRVIALASTKIDSRKKNISEIRIDVSEFIDVYQLQKNHHVYELLHNAVKSIMRKSIKLDAGNGKIRESTWLDTSQYKKASDGSHVLIKFSRTVEPYLFELKERFTSINFEVASRLNTPFSFRLYQWLIKARSVKKYKKGEAIAVELEVDWMKEQAQIKGRYEVWGNFYTRVLEPAIAKINGITDISVTTELIKKGRSIHAVRFIYVTESATNSKPLRPKLVKRPSVARGSHEEGEWMRKNIKLLVDYRNALKAYDNKLNLSLPDVRKLHEYCLGVGDKERADFFKQEIDARTSPQKSKKEIPSNEEVAPEFLLKTLAAFKDDEMLKKLLLSLIKHGEAIKKALGEV
ncbi:MAG: replication initiation protein [Enterovibrio sp.]